MARRSSTRLGARRSSARQSQLRPVEDQPEEERDVAPSLWESLITEATASSDKTLHLAPTSGDTIRPKPRGWHREARPTTRSSSTISSTDGNNKSRPTTIWKRWSPSKKLKETKYDGEVRCLRSGRQVFVAGAPPTDGKVAKKLCVVDRRRESGLADLLVEAGNSQGEIGKRRKGVAASRDREVERETRRKVPCKSGSSRSNGRVDDGVTTEDASSNNPGLSNDLTPAQLNPAEVEGNINSSEPLPAGNIDTDETLEDLIVFDRDDEAHGVGDNRAKIDDYTSQDEVQIPNEHEILVRNQNIPEQEGHIEQFIQTEDQARIEDAAHVNSMEQTGIEEESTCPNLKDPAEQLMGTQSIEYDDQTEYLSAVEGANESHEDPEIADIGQVDHADWTKEQETGDVDFDHGGQTVLETVAVVDITSLTGSIPTEEPRPYEDIQPLEDLLSIEYSPASIQNTSLKPSRLKSSADSASRQSPVLDSPQTCLHISKNASPIYPQLMAMCVDGNEEDAQQDSAVLLTSVTSVDDPIDHRGSGLGLESEVLGFSPVNQMDTDQMTEREETSMRPSDENFEAFAQSLLDLSPSLIGSGARERKPCLPKEVAQLDNMTEELTEYTYPVDQDLPEDSRKLYAVPGPQDFDPQDFEPEEEEGPGETAGSQGDDFFDLDMDAAYGSSKPTPLSPPKYEYPEPPAPESSLEETTTVKVNFNDDDDEQVLRGFLSRSEASKAAKIARRTSQDHRRDSGAVKSALSTTPQVLEELDRNSPSPRRNRDTEKPLATILPSPLAKKQSPADELGDVDELASTAPEPRRSKRGRRMNKDTADSQDSDPLTTTLITVKRRVHIPELDIKTVEAGEVATLTAANTRRNKCGASRPKTTLARIKVQRPETFGTPPVVVGAKSVTWNDERLVEYFEEKNHTRKHMRTEELEDDGNGDQGSSASSSRKVRKILSRPSMSLKLPSGASGFSAGGQTTDDASSTISQDKENVVAASVDTMDVSKNKEKAGSTPAKGATSRVPVTRRRSMVPRVCAPSTRK